MLKVISIYCILLSELFLQLAVKSFSQGRNPFRCNLTPNFGTPNPLQHLTDKVIGFKTSNTPTHGTDINNESVESETEVVSI